MPHRSRQTQRRRTPAPSSNLHPFHFSTQAYGRPQLDDEEEVSPRTVTFPGIPQLAAVPNEHPGSGMVIDTTRHPNTYPDDNNARTQPVGHSPEYHILKDLCRLKAERASQVKWSRESKWSMLDTESAEESTHMSLQSLERTSLVEAFDRSQYRSGNSQTNRGRQVLNSFLRHPREVVEICDVVMVMNYMAKVCYAP